MTDCVIRLAQAKDALHATLTGVKTKSISDDGMSQDFVDLSTSELKTYINQLEEECGNGTGRKRGSVRFYG